MNLNLPVSGTRSKLTSATGRIQARRRDILRHIVDPTTTYADSVQPDSSVTAEPPAEEAPYVWATTRASGTRTTRVEALVLCLPRGSGM